MRLAQLLPQSAPAVLVALTAHFDIEVSLQQTKKLSPGSSLR